MVAQLGAKAILLAGRRQRLLSHSGQGLPGQQLQGVRACSAVVAGVSPFWLMPPPMPHSICRAVQVGMFSSRRRLLGRGFEPNKM